MSSGKVYLIDTDVLEHVRYRSDSAHLYSEIIKLAKAGIAQTVRQVFDELKKFKSTHTLLHPHEKEFCLRADLQFCEKVQNGLDLIHEHAGHLMNTFGGKNPDPADPWLIAVAWAHGYTVVTDERPDSSIKIPAACKLAPLGCSCITGPHFLIEVGIVQIKDIKPEHISAKAFFGYSG